MVKSFALACLFVSAFLGCVGSLQAASRQVGIGLGFQYPGGAGFQVARVTDTRLSFASVGCDLRQNTPTSDQGGKCGLGIGFVVTDMLVSSDRHGLGFGLNYQFVDASEGANRRRRSADIYFSYQYFFKGINRKGMSLGIALNVRAVGVDDAEIRPMIGLSYQF